MPRITPRKRTIIAGTGSAQSVREVSSPHSGEPIPPPPYRKITPVISGLFNVYIDKSMSYDQCSRTDQPQKRPISASFWAENVQKPAVLPRFRRENRPVLRRILTMPSRSRQNQAPATASNSDVSSALSFRLASALMRSSAGYRSPRRRASSPGSTRRGDSFPWQK